MYKIIIFLTIISFNSLAFDNLDPILSGNKILKSDFNNRISSLQSSYTSKGFNLTLPIINSDNIKSEDLNNIITIINSLNITTINLPLLDKKQPITAEIINNIFDTLNNIKLVCSTNTECYSISSQYNKAIFNNELLQVQNNFLFSSSKNQYLGSQCNEWYNPSELQWVDKKLDSNKNNFININYTSPADSINHIVYNSPAPTCGNLYYSGNQYCRTYGYPYLYVGNTTYMSSSVFGNGGCWSGSGIVEFQKGDTIQIGSHWGSNVQVRTGY